MEDKGENGQAVKYYRLSEIEEQNTFKSTWIIINFNVYDVTKFLEEVRKLGYTNGSYYSPSNVT